MQLLKIMLGAGGAMGVALAMTLVTTQVSKEAQAAPQVPAVEGPASALTAVAQRCWTRGGVRRCRWVGPRYYGYRTRYREYNNPDAYRTGSSRWWQEMDRLDRGGRGRR